MNVLDLFSGIGGFSLGLERAGMRTVAFCEIEPFARAVLAKHWPDVPCYDDVRTLSADRLRADGISVDVICGGFPCQDISSAGKRAGIRGERSGLWSEYARLIGELRPRFVIVENVAALLGRGLDVVLGDMAEIGYDAEWHCIRAADVGAPHLRDRIWIVAYPQHPDANCQRPYRAGVHLDRSAELRDQQEREPGSVCEDVADAARDVFSEQTESRAERQRTRPSGQQVAVAHTNSSYGLGRRSPLQVGWGWRASQIAEDGYAGGTEWLFEPDVGRVAHGVPSRVDRLRSLGNAVVPQIPEIIGRAIMNSLSHMDAVSK